jgi:hypothetical protein
MGKEKTQRRRTFPTAFEYPKHEIQAEGFGERILVALKPIILSSYIEIRKTWPN